MNDDLRARLLGEPGRDPGCDACFELLDRYAEAVLGGADVARLFPGVLTHVASCAACREDTEGLLAALRRAAASPSPDDPGEDSR